MSGTTNNTQKGKAMTTATARKTYWIVDGYTEPMTKAQAKRAAQADADYFREPVTITQFKQDRFGVDWDEKIERIYPS